jgi:hypothetical protein
VVDRRSVLLSALGTLSVLAAAGIFGAPASADTSTAPNYAGYTSTEFAKRVTATVTVPTVDCSGVAAGTYAGQSYGVQLDSGGLQIAADVRAYCDGTTANYTIEEAVPARGEQRFAPATFTVAPGDTVQLTVWADHQGNHATALTYTNGVGREYGSLSRKHLVDAVPYLVATTIAANAHGAPLLSGRVAAGGPVIAGPVSATDVAFTAAKVNGKPAGQLNPLDMVTWVGPSDEKLVSPTGFNARGTAFTFTSPL